MKPTKEDYLELYELYKALERVYANKCAYYLNNSTGIRKRMFDIYSVAYESVRLEFIDKYRFIYDSVIKFYESKIGTDANIFINFQSLSHSNWKFTFYALWVKDRIAISYDENFNPCAVIEGVHGNNSYLQVVKKREYLNELTSNRL